MKRILWLVLLTISSVSFALAQSDDYHKNEFFAGYSYERSGGENANGFNAAYTYNLTRYFGLKADFSGHFRRTSINSGLITFTSKGDIYRFMGGVQIKDNSTNKKVKPFAHLLVGGGAFKSSGRFSTGSFSDTSTSGAAAIGGGLDIKVSNRISVRAIQVDYAPFFTTNAFGSAARVSAGVVFH